MPRPTPVARLPGSAAASFSTIVAGPARSGSSYVSETLWLSLIWPVPIRSRVNAAMGPAPRARTSHSRSSSSAVWMILSESAGEARPSGVIATGDELPAHGHSGFVGTPLHGFGMVGCGGGAGCGVRFLFAKASSAERTMYSYAAVPPPGFGVVLCSQFKLFFDFVRERSARHFVVADAVVLRLR